MAKKSPIGPIAGSISPYDFKVKLEMAASTTTCMCRRCRRARARFKKNG